MLSGEGEFGDLCVRTWRDQDLNEDDHPCDSARDCSVKNVSTVVYRPLSFIDRSLTMLQQVLPRK